MTHRGSEEKRHVTLVRAKMEAVIKILNKADLDKSGNQKKKKKKKKMKLKKKEDGECTFSGELRLEEGEKERRKEEEKRHQEHRRVRINADQRGWSARKAART
mmetsp:Transcript_45422/g.98050  ORF Transcript_45422/g.98050 Transcript_45422/m.98050 type:complete len:103 (+) Transcript_45422:5-313(+)